MSISRDAVIEWMKAFAGLIAENKDYLTQLDSAIGDADHGTNMNRGMQAVLTKLPTVADKDIGTVFKTVGMTLVSTVGGASGPLYGTFFMQMGTVTANKLELTLKDWADALEAAINGVVMRGKAQVGDKTMVDALTPALAALKEANVNGDSISVALQKSVEAAAKGRDDTIPLVARKGRASYLGERSAGHQDPGATSSHLLLLTAAQTLAK
ncbi:MAG TPA: dihydroxyacetone kinase subunit DhaL [Aggregatilineales bacterium]|nr:dihydroxyacetone kinase subunit DhaL [Aggregatilineales bacterium]